MTVGYLDEKMVFWSVFQFLHLLYHFRNMLPIDQEVSTMGIGTPGLVADKEQVKSTTVNYA